MRAEQGCTPTEAKLYRKAVQTQKHMANGSLDTCKIAYGGSNDKKLSPQFDQRIDAGNMTPGQANKSYTYFSVEPGRNGH